MTRTTTYTIGLLIVINMILLIATVQISEKVVRMEQAVNRNNQRIFELEKWSLKKSAVLDIKPVTVTITGYTSRKEETDNTPNQTAFLTIPKPWTVAVSRDLFLKGWVPGRKVYIYQVGVFRINDLMHPEKTQQLDIFFTSLRQAKAFGIKQAKAILL